MLDEIKELGLYTYKVGTAPFLEAIPMLYPTKENSLSCMPHALEMVTRHCLYHDGATFEEAVTRVDDALGALSDWCALAGAEGAAARIPGLEACGGWMARYIPAACAHYSGHNEEKMQHWWSTRLYKYEAPIFEVNRLDESDINKASYELTIARALRKGPLKRFCMVSTLEPTLVHKACTTSTPKKDGTFGRLNVANNGKVIAFTALCLKGLGRTGGVPETGFVPVNEQEYAAWLGMEQSARKKISTLKEWRYQGEPLFLKDDEISGIMRWRVNQAWLDDGHWQLIDITNSDESLREFCRTHAGEGYYCYLDGSYNDPAFQLDDATGCLRAFACEDYQS